MAKKHPSKKYKAALEKIDQEKLYDIKEASSLAIETSVTKFDSSVEIHINLSVDVKHADQIVRGTLVLPHGTGKTPRIAAFTEADKEKEAKDAGADLVGLDNLIAEVSKGNIDFDIAVAEPAVMKNLGKIAKNLGTKGLMPSPKAGTVTPDIVKAITEIKKGKVEYKTDKNGLIHCMIGKVSFGADKIEENAKMLLDAILAAKPSAVKGKYINSISLASTMGPGVSVEY
ncbi:50S ribosomal protein L1 [Candidatus Peregrinibacteria bacterium]|jgi:large subunit ribosomal protein L1|nr:50S ribosomal protein L1 [Candidatus Peregrinibacteria bacterium]